MANTANYNWETPDDTDLVKDGAAAIRTLGSAIDTTVFNNASAAIAKSIVDAKGDLIAATAADTVARLASSGVNGEVLTVDTSTATGLKWAAPSSGGMTEIASGTLSGGSVVLSSIPSTYKNLQLIIKNYKPATDDTNLAIRFNGDSTANRYEYGSAVVSSNDTFERTDIQIQIGQDNTVAQGMYRIDIPDYANTTTWKILEALAVGNNPTTSTNLFYIRNWGVYNQTAAINSITLFPASGNFTSGDYILYGVK